MFENFHGNAAVARALSGMISTGRIAQTILLAGPEGVGKATLARRFGAALLGGSAKIEWDDLSLPANAELIAEREKWPSEKRNEDPLLFSSHPDFITFAPDGPLRQLTIPQMRLLRERAQFKPLKGARRVFLIDRLDRANDQAANSLLKTLEEPPDHLVLVATAENAYDLLPTIRSRSVVLNLSPLDEAAMDGFLRSWQAEHGPLPDLERRRTLAAGSPGRAVAMNLELYDKRRAAMLALLKAGARITPFGAWARVSESLSASKSEKLEELMMVLYGLLGDVVQLSQGGPAQMRNVDIRADLQNLAAKVTLAWLAAATARADDMIREARRNIQKGIALDAFAVEMARLSAA